MLNQSFRRLQEVCRKLARHALLGNRMPPKLIAHSEDSWLRMKKASAALFETIPRAVCIPKRASIVRVFACNHF
jgi:hypothetical protein